MFDFDHSNPGDSAEPADVHSNASSSRCTEYSTCSSTPRDYVGDWAKKRDGWFYAHKRNANGPSYPIYVRTGLVPLRMRRKAERTVEKKSIATIKKHLNSSFKATLTETALTLAAVAPETMQLQVEDNQQTSKIKETFLQIMKKLGYWLPIGGKYILICGILVNLAFLAFLLYVFHTETGEKRYNEKMSRAGTALKVLFFVLRLLVGPEIY